MLIRKKSILIFFIISFISIAFVLKLSPKVLDVTKVSNIPKDTITIKDFKTQLESEGIVGNFHEPTAYKGSGKYLLKTFNCHNASCLDQINITITGNISNIPTGPARIIGIKYKASKIDESNFELVLDESRSEKFFVDEKLIIKACNEKLLSENNEIKERLLKKLREDNYKFKESSDSLIDEALMMNFTEKASLMLGYKGEAVELQKQLALPRNVYDHDVMRAYLINCNYSLIKSSADNIYIGTTDFNLTGI